MVMKNEFRQYIGVQEAAQHKGVTRKSIRDAILEGKLVGGQFRGKVIVASDSLEDYQPRAYPRKEELPKES